MVSGSYETGGKKGLSQHDDAKPCSAYNKIIFRFKFYLLISTNSTRKLLPSTMKWIQRDGKVVLNISFIQRGPQSIVTVLEKIRRQLFILLRKLFQVKFYILQNLSSTKRLFIRLQCNFSFLKRLPLNIFTPYNCFATFGYYFHCSF